MALVRKSAKRVKTIRKKVEYLAFYGFAKEKSAKTLVAVKSRNCDFRGGRLGCGVGVKKYRLSHDETIELPILPDTFGTCERFFAHSYLVDGVKLETIGVNTSSGRLLVFENDGKVLRAIESSAKLKKGLTVYDADGVASVLVCGEKKTYLYSFLTGATMLFQNASIVGGCVCRERVVLGGGFTVYYSAPLDASDFSESIDGAGKVELPSILGEIVGVISLGENVFVFRRFGITKLTGGGAGREFVFEDLPYASAGIVGESIVICKDEILFLSAEGICAFNGNRVRSVSYGLLRAPMRSTHTCYGAFAFGRYYLSYLDVDGMRRNVFVDLNDEKNVGETFLAQGLPDSCGRAICGIGGEILELEMNAELPSGEEYLFDVGALDFGDTGEKVLRKIVLRGRGQCVLTVSGRNGEKELFFDMENGGETALDALLKGERFSLLFRLVKGCEIESMKVTYDKVEGVAV